MAGLPLMAGGAGGDADALRAQLRDDVAAGVAYQRHRQNVGRGTAAHRHNAAHVQQLCPAVFLQRRHVRQLFFIALLPQLHGLGKSGDLRRGLRARAQAALLSAAGQQGTGIPHPPADVQRADPLGSAQLVGGQAHHIHAPAFRVAVYLHEALHRVAVQQGGGVLLPQQRRRLPYREHAARLVVHQHHGHQRRVLPQGGGHLLHSDIAVPPRLQAGDLIALLRQPSARLQHGAVLHSGGDDVLALVPVLPQGGLYRPVVAFRAAGGEIQAFRLAAQRPGDDGAPALHSGFHLHAHGILGGGVAELLRQHLIHGIGHGAGHRRGGGIVEIDHGRPPVFLSRYLSDPVK